MRQEAGWPGVALSSPSGETAGMGKRTHAAVQLGPWGLTIGQIEAVARRGSAVKVTAEAKAAMKRSRGVVERALGDGKPHYGINTGFGSLAKQRIGPDDLRALQRNLVRSHSAGVGEPLRPELVRAMMVVLAGSLARGLSGVRPVVVETLCGMINGGVTPVIPSIGSVGASGDLAPLAHLALALIGEGEAILDPDFRAPSLRATDFSRRIPAARALTQAGLKPVTLEAKEGLALINGTHLMCAEGALLCADARTLMTAAITALAMSMDACRATHTFLDVRLYHARQLETAAAVAMSLRDLLDHSQIAQSHVENDPRVQDPYSLRAAPTVLGAVIEAVDQVERAFRRELHAVTDNPLVFPQGVVELVAKAGAGSDGVKGGSFVRAIKSAADVVISGANFHGMPLAMPLDHLAIAVAHVAGISERRTYLMTGAFEPESHLKPFLAPRPGLQSGLMIAQYTAAACVNELIGLANPASVANVPTCAGMEDYNSYGPRSAAKARRGIELARRVVAIEMLCAAQGLEGHRPLRSGDGVERAVKQIREVVPTLKEDRPLTADIEAITTLIADGAFAAEAG